MVKVYIAYAGKNRNFSIISKETFEKMIPSLYGIPIVGEWKEEKEDFGTHGGKIEISDEGIKYIETTKPLALWILLQQYNGRMWKKKMEQLMNILLLQRFFGLIAIQKY